MDRPRFADGQLDDVASAMVRANELAGQYLEQAPVLAVLALGKYPAHISYGELDRFTATVAAQPRLRDLLSTYGGSLPLRKLQPAGLRSRHRRAVAELARIDTSTLSQSIPDDSQQVWLDGIEKWRTLAPAKKALRASFNVAWIARRLGENLARYEQVDALIDFIRRGRNTLNERWTWDRAMAEVHAWHRRINDERAIAASLADAKRAADFDRVICKAPIPDSANVDGYDFIALRTARQLREEGTVMHHCVASYAGGVKKGRLAIVSVRRDGVNVATMELNAKGVVSQLKSHCNARPSDAIRTACDTYALLNWRPTDPAEERKAA